MLLYLHHPDIEHDYIMANSVFSSKRLESLLSLSGFKSQVLEKEARNHHPKIVAKELLASKQQPKNVLGIILEV